MERSTRLGVFAVFWAVAELFHQASNTRFGASAGETVLTLLAAWLLLRPASIGRLLLFVAAQIVVVADQLPYVSNHLLLAALVNATILASAALLYLREKPINGNRLFWTMAPPVRLLLICFYVWTAVHKINTAYL